jgi:chromosome segregation ATPase
LTETEGQVKELESDMKQTKSKLNEVSTTQAKSVTALEGLEKRIEATNRGIDGKMITFKQDIETQLGNLEGKTISDVKQQIETDLETLRNQCRENQKELEEKLKEIKKAPSQGEVLQTVSSDMEERSQRGNKLILHNVPEDKSPVIDTRIAIDTELVRKLFGQELNTQGEIIKVSRIGKQSEDGARPLRVIMGSDAQA